MRRLCTVLLIVAVVSLACRNEDPANANTPDNAIAPPQKPAMNGLKPEAYAELIHAVEPLLATVLCLSHTFENEGTRSEKVLIRVRLLQVAVGEVAAEHEIFLERYTQANPYLSPGKTYLVAAYKEWADHFYLAGWSAVEPDLAPDVLEAAAQTLAAQR